ncbi:hypothetical protein C2G38_2124259 [Gigaspora rosea]|uniref:Uncharacterized protein n=1 Tax=Gigaspora rosea TaxID=44941 RepID=A0A397TXY6_9GLOM|nr:hypothetical protein C2G38_2124259 [Gigaspora rosea]
MMFQLVVVFRSMTCCFGIQIFLDHLFWFCELYESINLLCIFFIFILSFFLAFTNIFFLFWYYLSELYICKLT